MLLCIYVQFKFYNIIGTKGILGIFHLAWLRYRKLTLYKCLHASIDAECRCKCILYSICNIDAI